MFQGKSIITSFLILFSLTAFGQKDKGDRMLAWQIDVAENDNYDSAFAYAKDACMETAHLFLTWSALQPDTSTFDAVTIASFLDVLDLYYPANNMAVELQFAVMNTVAKECPSELMAVPFNNANMISNFKKAIDTIFAHIPNLELSAFNIGNESDVFMGIDSTQYAQFKLFLDDVIPYVKNKYITIHGKELKVGTTFTHAGLLDPNRKNLCEMVNENRDIVSVTYYPLNSDFTMKEPSVVEEDFSDVVDIYSDTAQPIYFVECGYSSSSVCNSSEAQQADFFVEVFDTWDTYADNIKYITIFKSTDWSLKEVQDLSVYYGISDTVFIEYLRSLGVRTWNNDGSNKLAFDRIKCLLKERNWCNTSCIFTGLDDEEKTPEFELFPNPSSGSFNVLGCNLGDRIHVYNQVGEMVFETIYTYSNQEILIPNYLNSGIYYIQIETQGNTLTKKLILQKF